LVDYIVQKRKKMRKKMRVQMRRVRRRVQKRKIMRVPFNSFPVFVDNYFA
jgi:hypothetical protein